MLNNDDLQIYRRHIEQGFRKLRFESTLEKTFRETFYQRNLLRQRAAILLGLAMLLCLAPLDLPQLEGTLRQAYLWSRIYTACPVLVVVLAMTFLFEHYKRYFQLAAFVVITYAGLATNWLVVCINKDGGHLPYEGASLIMMTCYLLGGLLFRQALLCTTIISTSYFLMAYYVDYPFDAYQVFFISSFWAVGAVGAYVIEFNARFNFLQRGLVAAMAKTDALTGVLNRGALNERLRELFEYAKREKKYLTLLMIDVDYFKRFNDIYGHIEGDQCLTRIAEALSRSCRRTFDFVGRYGGEEFLLLWFDTRPDEADTLRKVVSDHVVSLHIAHQGSETSEEVTISGGMITARPETDSSIHYFLRAADDLLYRAKTAGRNQILSRIL